MRQEERNKLLGPLRILFLLVQYPASGILFDVPLTNLSFLWNLNNVVWHVSKALATALTDLPSSLTISEARSKILRGTPLLVTLFLTLGILKNRIQFLLLDDLFTIGQQINWLFSCFHRNMYVANLSHSTTDRTIISNFCSTIYSGNYFV